MITLSDNDSDISVTMFLYDNSDRSGDIDNDSKRSVTLVVSFIGKINNSDTGSDKDLVHH
jgi:hypothetical protein